MKIIDDVQWHRDLARGQVPEPGERHTVWLAESELNPEADQPLLWVPPYSELNGWDSQPSDIAVSQIITARLTRTSRPPGDTRVECTAAVLARINLLEACHAAQDDTSCDALLYANLHSAVFWNQVHWCGKATLGDMTFVDVVAGEAAMAMLFTGLPDACNVRYAQFSVAGTSCAAVGNWTLQGEVLRAVARHVTAAVSLTDTGTP
jgi:hypothetical protein